MITEIIKELNLENGSNYKLEVLRKHKDNDLLQRVLKMTYDRAAYTYGITMKNIEPRYEIGSGCPLEDALDFMETKLCTREFTGHAALEAMKFHLEFTTKDDAKLLEMILGRDLRINLGKTQINKVWKNLITKPPYMRCSLKDKISRVKYPAYSQIKEDGTYRSIIKNGEDITIMGRSGEVDDFPKFKEKIANLKDGVYIGELLLHNEKNRLKANGLINSDTEQDDMYFSAWDYLTLNEWDEKKSTTAYGLRLTELDSIFENEDDSIVRVVETKIVNSYEEAMDHYKNAIERGLEGTVLKDKNTPFKDHTSPTQIKMKEEAVAEFIIVDFQEGKGRLKGTLGSMYYKSQCGQVQGKMGGFSDDDRKDIWENRDKYLNAICSLKYNGVTKAENNDYFSLMYANFIEHRPEKDVADDLEYIKNALK